MPVHISYCILQFVLPSFSDNHGQNITERPIFPPIPPNNVENHDTSLLSYVE